MLTAARCCRLQYLCWLALVPAELQRGSGIMERNDAIKAIKAALKSRSGKTWSVVGGRGSAWGWITISAPPARCTEFGSMTADDAAELGKLFGMAAHHQGISVPASMAHRREYVARAAGQPFDVAAQYWD